MTQTETDKHRTISRKNNVRSAIVATVLLIYFGFSFGWSSLNVWFSSINAVTDVPHSIMIFSGTILAFILLEGLYLYLINRAAKLVKSVGSSHADSGETREPPK